MATIYPRIRELTSTNFKRAKPSTNELRILQFFERNLSDGYEVYFRPFFNGLRPSFVVFRENSGMLIIDYYESFSDFEILLPNKKFEYQKFELLDLILTPEEKELNKKSLLSTIHGAAIVNESSESLTKRFSEVKYYTYFSYERFFDSPTFDYYLKKIYLKFDSIFYPSDCYKEIKRYLKPSLHTIEEGREFYPNAKQKLLIVSKSGDQRVKGVAGTGKTSVLAQKAVSANARTQSEVLILSFNITIRHYIRQKLENVKKEFLRTDFHISHYHDFFKNQAIQFKSVKPKIGDWEKTEYFEDVKYKLPKYSSIIVDEAQDYKREWVVILKTYFLKEGGEFVIYFDANQDIYHRRSIEQFPILGRPNELSKSYRLSQTIANLTKKFINSHMDITEPFEIEEDKIALDFQEFRENISYKYFESNVTEEELYQYIKKQISISNSSPDDIGIIGTSINKVRNIEHYFRTSKHELTTRMFESKEEYDQLLQKIKDGEHSHEFKMALKELRRQYKLHKFRLATGSMKFSSIHSFKGWEIHTLFLLLNEEEFQSNLSGVEHEDDFLNEQLIYTGITRARNNLNIINIGCLKYHDFFKREI